MFSFNTENGYRNMRGDDSPPGCHVAIRSPLACT